MQTLESIVNKFPISNDEYADLDKKFGNLTYYAAWRLRKNNTKNSMTNDPDDDVQQLRIALLRAGSYYKRQTYIEECLNVVGDYVTDKFLKSIVDELKQLWLDRKRHGANRQKFGDFQEQFLERLVRKYVPKDERPDRRKRLVIDADFATYCKQIVWNEQKSLGKQITREKSWRTGLVSLSEFDYLCSTD